jgi:hypothetical protein
MAWQRGWTRNFRLQLDLGVLEYAMPWRVALYKNSAQLDKSNVSVYSPTHEVSGGGYTPTGAVVQPSFYDAGYRYPFLSFSDAVFENITEPEVRGATLIYYHPTLWLVAAVIDFGKIHNVANRRIRVRCPVPTVDQAFLRFRA